MVDEYTQGIAYKKGFVQSGGEGSEIWGVGRSGGVAVSSK